MRRRLSALSSFYRYCAAHDLVTGSRLRGWRGRWWTRTTPPPSAWTATRYAPWSRPPTPTGAAGAADRGGDPAAGAQCAAGGRGLRRRRRRPRRRRRTGSCACSARAPGRRKSSWPRRQQPRWTPTLRSGPAAAGSATREQGRPAPGHRQRRPPPAGAPVGTGAPPGPRLGHRGLGPAVPALPAALGDHLRARRWRGTARRAGLRRAQGSRTTRRYDQPGTAWTATPPTRSRPTSPDRTHSWWPSVARPL